jgi:hypothetical protein
LEFITLLGARDKMAKADQEAWSKTDNEAVAQNWNVVWRCCLWGLGFRV